MMTALFVLIFSVLADPSLAKDIHVAKTGSNSNLGASDNPYLTIRYAVAQSLEGDVIRVHAGIYDESWIEPKAGTRLISDDGLHVARIHSGNLSAIRLINNNSGIDGFEIYGDWNQGTPGDGLIRLLDASHLWVKNCKIHDAPHDCDVIKIGASDVLIENCIIYNAGLRTDGNYQEVVDIYGKSAPDGVTVRGCWIYHTPEQGGDYLIYAKGGARNILWENNVFGPARGGGFGNVSTGCGAASPPVFPSCENFIARNNIFVNCAGDGAFGFTSAKNAYVYNNVFYNYTGGRAIIQFYSTQSPGGTDRNEDCYVLNNIFMQSNGMPVYQDRGRWSGGAYTYIPENFQSDHNLYYQVDSSSSENDINILEEASSIVNLADPKMVAPSSPDPAIDSWRTIVANFLLLPDSPAMDKGCDLSSGAPFHVPFDILGTVRPTDVFFDMGIHELAKNNVDLDFDGDVDGEDLAGLINSVELTADYNQAMAARFGS